MNLANSILKRHFPQDARYKEESLRLAELSKEARFQKYQNLELLLFILLFAYLIYLYLIWPVEYLRSCAPGIIDIEMNWTFLIYGITALVAVPHAAYICNAVTRVIFKAFNPEENSEIIYFVSKIMNPTNSGYAADYNIIDGHKILAAVMTFLWGISLFVTLNHYVLVGNDFLLIKNDLFKSPIDYKFNNLEIKIESTTDYTPPDRLPYQNIIFTFAQNGSQILRMGRTNKIGTLDNKIVLALKPFVKK